VADERLRELERAAARGEPASRARLLRERVRLGEGEPGRLRLAAALLGEPCDGRPAPPPEPSIFAWVRSLGQGGSRAAAWGRIAPEAGLRAAVAAARAALPVWEPAGGGGPRRAIEAAEAWLCCPCAAHRRAVPAARRHLYGPGGRTPTPHRWGVASPQPYGPSYRRATPSARRVVEAAASLLTALDAPSRAAWTAWTAARATGDEAAVRNAVTREVVAWALALEDPLQARLRARGDLETDPGPPGVEAT